MDVALYPPEEPQVALAAATWLRQLLTNPRLEGVSKPPSVNGGIYIGGLFKTMINGRWEISDGSLYLAGSTSSNNIPIFSRLAILAAVACLTKCMTGDIADKFATRLAEEVRNSTIQIHNMLVASPVKPQRLAVDTTNCLVAAEMNNVWSLPSGAPVEVNPSWIIMNF